MEITLTAGTAFTALFLTPQGPVEFKSEWLRNLTLSEAIVSLEESAADRGATNWLALAKTANGDQVAFETGRGLALIEH